MRNDIKFIGSTYKIKVEIKWGIWVYVMNLINKYFSRLMIIKIVMPVWPQIKNSVNELIW